MEILLAGSIAIGLLSMAVAIGSLRVMNKYVREQSESDRRSMKFKKRAIYLMNDICAYLREDRKNR